MKELEIQKQLRDLNCFIHKHSTVAIQIRGCCSKTVWIPDAETDRIHITADNPYQMNLIIEDSAPHGTIYHISNEARMLIVSEDNNESSLVFIRDEDHTISILFDEKNWKNTEQ